MLKKAISLLELLERLEVHYGKQLPYWPTEPYEFLVWWHCGYPQSDERCAKGWAALTARMDIAPKTLLAAKPEKLASALKQGGMVPELRALRLKEIAMRVQDQFGGDLPGALAGPIAHARKVLKMFPNIGDPGADRILLFAGIAPVAAVPSNNVSVIVRVLYGRERENYGVNYRESQHAIEGAIPADLGARSRAYLLLKRHGQELCKRTNPKCDQCPVRDRCAYFAGNMRGRSAQASIPGSRR
ncbi:MAG: endonuclease III domain-containing protein [Terriglobales bacterium]